MRLRLAVVLAAACAWAPGARGGDAASSWYYKSAHACTNSDGPGTQKCRADAEGWGCAGGPDGLYCGENEKQTCEEIGAGISAESPDGFGFMCPSLMLGTAEMLAAAKADGYLGAYAVVTIDMLSCGQCVEIENDDPASFPGAPRITAQVFNSVASSVDVYMAGGGLGANNGCAAVGGYSPMAAMYEKYPTSENSEFVGHLKKAGYPDAERWLDDAISYAGGLRGGRAYASCMASGRNTTAQCQPPGNGCDGLSGVCITDPLAACTSAFAGRSDYVTQKAVESCMYAFEHDLHWNRPITYQVVPCPPGLTALTGMIPDAFGESERGERVKSTTTTMEDCCEPTCSRASAVKDAKEPGSWTRGNEVIYTCNVVGETFLESTSRFPDPCDRDGAEPDMRGEPGPLGGPPLDQEGALSSAPPASAARLGAPSQSHDGPAGALAQSPTAAPTSSSSAPPASTARIGAPSQSPAGLPTQGSAGASAQSPTAAPTSGPADEPGPSLLRGGGLPAQASGGSVSSALRAPTGAASAAGGPPGQGVAGAASEAAGSQQCPDAYEQCGGAGWSGAGCCQGACVCTAYAESYSQCVPPDGGAGCGGPAAPLSDGAAVVIVRKDVQLGTGARPVAQGEAAAARGVLAVAGVLSALLALAVWGRSAARRRSGAGPCGGRAYPRAPLRALERGEDVGEAAAVPAE